MAFALEDVLDGVRCSRKHLLKHLNGVQEAQWNWKPYAECKSIVETLAHLIVDDRMAIESMQTGEEPNYEAAQTTERDVSKLLAMLEESHAQLLSLIETKFVGQPLDTEIVIWGGKQKLGRGVAYLSSEDYYHAGQIAFIRVANDPTWNYYADIYGK